MIPMDNLKIAQPDDGPRAVSPQEIEAGKSPKGGWTAATLAGWGVSWPPPRGWRKALEDEWRRKHGPPPAEPEPTRRIEARDLMELSESFAAKAGQLSARLKRIAEAVESLPALIPLCQPIADSGELEIRKVGGNWRIVFCEKSAVPPRVYAISIAPIHVKAAIALSLPAFLLSLIDEFEARTADIDDALKSLLELGLC